MVQLKELEFFISAPYLFKTITLAATIPSGGMIKRGISMKPLAWDLSLFSRALSCLCQQLQVHIFDITIRFIASPDIEHFLSTNLPPTLTDTSLRYSTLLVCDTPTNTQCTGCKSAYYRSTAHIAQGWSTHKAYCKRVSAASTNTFDAVLFGVNETKPRPIKVPWLYGSVDDNDVGSWQKLEDEPWFNRRGRNCSLRYLSVRTFGSNGPSLGRTLALRYDDNSLINGSPLNRCILNTTQGKAAHPWVGNILAVRSNGISDRYSNVIMEDLASVVRFFEDYGK